MKIFGYKPSATAWIGMAIILAFLLIAIFADFIAPYGEAESVGQTWDDPSFANWLGTDNIGRDMLSRLIFGARMTIGVALVTTILSFCIGITAGFMAAVGGPVIDQILSRLVDVMLSIPLLIFALIILSVLARQSRH